MAIKPGKETVSKQKQKALFYFRTCFASTLSDWTKSMNCFSVQQEFQIMKYIGIIFG